MAIATWNSMFTTQAAVTAVVLCILFRVYQRVVEDRQVRKLGHHAHAIPSWLPLGIDVIATTLYDALRNRDLESFQSYFRGGPAGTATAQVTLAGLRCIFTADPENLKAVLSTQFADYGKGARFHDDWKAFLGDSIFTTDGAAWQSSRQQIKPHFFTERVSDLQVFERHCQILIQHIIRSNVAEKRKGQAVIGEKTGTSVEICDLFLRYTLDTSTDFLLGNSVNSITNPQQEFAKAFAEVQRVQTLIAKAGPASKLIPRSSYKSGLKTINDFITPIIDQALFPATSKTGSRNNGAKYTFLHALVESTQDRTILRDQIVAILLAGRDSTASALSWTFFEFSRRPDIVRRLRAEIVDAIGMESPPTYSSLKNMKYLQNVIKETLRLYPPVPFNVRFALQDTTLPRGGGPNGDLPVGILKDTLIGYSTLAMQRRQDLYPHDTDPLEYDPDRWLPWQPKPWSYIPFNGGPRICVGQQFALTEIGYTIVRILQRFERIERCETTQVEGLAPRFKSDIVLQPLDEVLLRFHEGNAV